MLALFMMLGIRDGLYINYQLFSPRQYMSPQQEGVRDEIIV